MLVRSILIAVIGLMGLVPAVTSAQAANDEQRGFWQKGAATDWSTPVHGNSSEAIVYRDYPLTIDEVKQRIHKDAEEAVKAAQSAIDANNVTAGAGADNQAKEPMTREQIIAKYGSPSQPLPIRAQKDSPPEMQALFEALNSGDKELAWQYSVALAERNNRIKQVVSKATDYQLLALEATGQRPAKELNPESDDIGSTRLEVRDFMDRTRLEQQRKGLQIDQAMLGSEEASGRSELSIARPKNQEKLGHEIPVDPAGKVKLLIFFDERSPKIKEFAKSLKPVQERFKGDPNISILGLTMRSYAVPGLKRIGEITSFPFPLVNGEALAPELRIQRYPSLVFLAVTSKRTYRVEEPIGAVEVERILKVMKGTSK